MAPDKKQMKAEIVACKILEDDLRYQQADGRDTESECFCKCGRPSRAGGTCPFCLVTECATALLLKGEGRNAILTSEPQERR